MTPELSLRVMPGRYRPCPAIYALQFRLFAPLRFLNQIRLALFYPREQIKQLVGCEQDGIHVIARLQEIHTRRQARDLDVFHAYPPVSVWQSHGQEERWA